MQKSFINYQLQKEALVFPEDFPFDFYNAKGTRRTHSILHQHDCLEINYVIGGYGVNYIDDKKYVMEEGDIYIINNKQHHIAISDGTLSMKVLIFEPQLIFNNNATYYNYIKPFYSNVIRLSNRIHTQEKYRESIKTIFQQIENEWNGHKEGYRLFIIAKMMELLAIIYRIIQKADCTDDLLYSQTAYERIQASLQYMDEHINEQLHLQELAILSCMSRTYFCSYFKKAMNMTPFQYMELIRINKACLLLKTTSQSIVEICYSSGFTNISSFNHSFKKICGVTPSIYRKNIIEKNS